MWPFKRKQSNQSVPAEVEEYYQSERRERVGVAWLLAFATLVTTLLLAVGLFFGGRWVYRKLAGDDKPKKPTIGVTTPKPSTQPSTPGASPTQPSQTPGQTNTTPPTSQPGGTHPQSPSSDDNTPDVEDPDTEIAQNHTTAPLPKTGPAETLTVFVLVSVVSGLLHFTISRYKTSLR